MSKLVRLGAFTFDEARSRLQGPDGPIDVRRKTFEVLHYLVNHPDRVIPRMSLLRPFGRRWSLEMTRPAQCVTEIRRALGPSGRTIVKTVPRRGYMLAIPETGGALPAATSPTNPIELPSRPSIAVLPLANLGGSPEDDYLSDGIAEDVITELSRFSELLVIARNSSFQYDGRSINVRQIGRELGVRYVLEGSVRRHENRVRISAQLIDAERRCTSGLSVMTACSRTFSQFKMRLHVKSSPCLRCT